MAKLSQNNVEGLGYGVGVKCSTQRLWLDHQPGKKINYVLHIDKKEQCSERNYCYWLLAENCKEIRETLDAYVLWLELGFPSSTSIFEWWWQHVAVLNHWNNSIHPQESSKTDFTASSEPRTHFSFFSDDLRETKFSWVKRWSQHWNGSQALYIKKTWENHKNKTWKTWLVTYTLRRRIATSVHSAGLNTMLLLVKLSTHQNTLYM